MGRPVLRTPLCDVLDAIAAVRRLTNVTRLYSGKTARALNNPMVVLEEMVREAIDVLSALSRTSVTFAVA